jgi:hypothetical protein
MAELASHDLWTADAGSENRLFDEKSESAIARLQEALSLHTHANCLFHIVASAPSAGNGPEYGCSVGTRLHDAWQ